MAVSNKKRKNKKHSAGTAVFTVMTVLFSIFVIYVVFQAVYVQRIYDNSRKENDIKSDCPKTIQNISVTTDFLPIGSDGRTGKIRKIKYITIHETDNKSPTADAEAHNEYIHDYGRNHKLSWHYTVDENEIYHHIPDDETAFNAGDNIRKNGGNRNGIGIELCVNKGSDFDKTMKNASILTAYLLDKYNLTIDDVKKHQDFSGKICPKTIINENLWDKFKQMTEQELKRRQKHKKSKK